MPRRQRQKDQFRFRQGFSVGALAAEHDELLDECFIASNQYESIQNVEDVHCALIGRSGSGKTAILDQLKKNKQLVVTIDPDALAFQFLGSSDLILALRASGVGLDYFYKLLWRHVFVVEILKAYFPEESATHGALAAVFSNIKKSIRPDRERDRAIRYLDEWSSNVLQAPQERIQEIHNTLEKNIKAGLKVTGGWSEIFGISGSTEVARTNTQTVSERVSIATTIVNQIQVQDLNTIKNYMGSEILNDPMKPCFVIIDDLDRFWVDDPLVYELIRGLILEIYEWYGVGRVKIVYALRDNILHRIEKDFTSRGYQREKLSDQRVYLRWSDAELTELLNKRLGRVSQLMKFSDSPTVADIMPSKTSNWPSGMEFVLERTLGRPRDVIDYVNKASTYATEKNKLSMAAIRSAEESYSRGRLDALFDEWRSNYPGLQVVTKLIENKPGRFRIESFSEDDLLELFTNPDIPTDGWGSDIAQEYQEMYKIDSIAATTSCLNRIFSVMYEVGILGVRIGNGATIEYSYSHEPLIPDTYLGNPETTLIVHPAFHKALRIPDTKKYK